MKQRIKVRTAIFAVAFMMVSGISLLSAQFLYRSTTGSHLFLGPLPVSNAPNLVGSNPNFFIGPNFGIEYNYNGLACLDIFIPWGGVYPYNQHVINVNNNGKVGIGMRSNAHALAVNGQVWTTAGLLITSDGTLKRNIKNMEDGRLDYVNKLKQLKSKTYEKLIVSSKDNEAEIKSMVEAGKIPVEEADAALRDLNERKKDTYKSEYGFIAQDLKELFPELVEEDGDGMLAINYTGLIPVLLEAIKDLQDKVEKLEQTTPFVDDLATRASGYTANEEVAGNIEYLSQNVPNPVDGSTVIRYSLPEGATQASIVIYSITGSVVKIIPINAGAKSGSITLYASDLAKGINVYNLTANGVVLGSKRMINP